jgi:hypothetical protein
VTTDSRSPAETTEVLLQAGIHRGVPVPIPGALEPRASRPAADLVPTSEAGATLHAAPSVEGRSQLDYELEGGGAPNERHGAAQGTVMARLRDWMRGV